MAKQKTGNRRERECSLTVISSNTIISPYLECLAKRGAGQKTARVRWSLNTTNMSVCLCCCGGTLTKWNGRNSKGSLPGDSDSELSSTLHCHILSITSNISVLYWDKFRQDTKIDIIKFNRHRSHLSLQGLGRGKAVQAVSSDTYSQVWGVWWRCAGRLKLCPYHSRLAASLVELVVGTFGNWREKRRCWDPGNVQLYLIFTYFLPADISDVTKKLTGKM